MNEEEVKISEDPVSDVSPDSPPPENQNPSGLQMGLTQFGHIGITVNDGSGTVAGHVITTVEEALAQAAHLMALATLMVQGAYAKAFADQEAAKAIMNNTPGLWKP